MNPTVKIAARINRPSPVSQGKFRPITVGAEAQRELGQERGRPHQKAGATHDIQQDAKAHLGEGQLQHHRDNADWTTTTGTRALDTAASRRGASPRSLDARAQVCPGQRDGRHPTREPASWFSTVES